MRSITQNAANAFLNNQSYKEGNTKVSPSNNKNYLYLHDNIIDILDKTDGTLQITNSGWFTNTTKERLNALPNISIQQKKGVWFLNGIEWDGKLIAIKNGN